ncbi:MAG: FG-GAP-like repeat-containing protein [bacterium]
MVAVKDIGSGKETNGEIKLEVKITNQCPLTSSSASISTAYDSRPPVITRGPLILEMTNNSATISWTTNEESTSKVEYGLKDYNASKKEVSDSSKVQEHKMILPGLVYGKTYQARVISEDEARNLVTSEIFLFTVITPKGGWPLALDNDEIHASPVIGDIDKDGKEDIIIASYYGKIYALSHDGKIKWSFTAGPRNYTWIESSPALGDIDKDGYLEVVIGVCDNTNTYKGKIYALNHDGTQKWSVSTDGHISSSPAIGDIDNDGYGEVIIGSEDKKVYALNHEGKSVNGWPKVTGSVGISSPALADINGENGLEIVISGGRDGKLYVWNHRGEALKGWPFNTNEGLFTSPVLGDINGDGKIEIAVASTNGNVYVWDTQGSLLKSWLMFSKTYSDGDIYSDLALGNIDQDGDLEIIAAAVEYSYSEKKLVNGGIYVWDHQGKLLFSQPTNGIPLSPAIGDINGDGKIDIVAGSEGSLWSGSNADISAWDQNGNLTLSWSVQGMEGNDVVLSDLDGDGKIDIVTGGTGRSDNEIKNRGLLCVWSLPDSQYYDVKNIHWPMYRHDARHIGLYPSSPDSTPPSKPVVTDDGDVTLDKTKLHAKWSASDPESGIAEYQYAIGTTSGGTDVVGWTSVGTTTEITKTGLNLTWGQTYYFAVKAKNGAGLWSEVGISNGIKVNDSTPPTKPVVTDDGDVTSDKTKLHAKWSSSDPESGIVEYQYAIGTTSGGTNVVGWTSVGLATEVTKSGLNLIWGQTYYFAVKAKNGAGLWSEVGVSNGIKVNDPTPPSKPVVTDDGDVTSDKTKLHAKWSASDRESGITEYQYAIGTTSGRTNVVGWTSVGLFTEVTKSGLNLIWGQAYYFAIRAKNGAGLWSGVGVSNGITVKDAAPPVVNITSPANGATVKGTVTVTANASDNVRVTKVEFYIDNSLKANDTSNPYSYAWNTPPLWLRGITPLRSSPTIRPETRPRRPVR